MLAILLSYSLISQTTIRVPSDLPSIQQALEEANAGDTVLVAPGIFNELLNWPTGKNLNLISETGSEETILDGGSQGPIINIESLPDESVLQGFTIQNGFSNIPDKVAALQIRDAKIDLIDLVIQNNNAEGLSIGSGAYLVNYDGRIESCRFLNNVNSSTRSNESTGLFIEAKNDIEIISCTFSNNQAFGSTPKVGAGITIIGTTSFLINIKGCTFNNNTATSSVVSSGGAIFINGSPISNIIRIDSCNFTGNKAKEGGAINLLGDTDTTISNCNFIQNIAASGDIVNNHGFIFLGGSTTSPLLISNCKITQNGDENSSQLFISQSASDFDMLNCELSHNRSGLIRTFLNNSQRTLTFQNCTVAFNGGPIVIDNTKLVISESIFWNDNIDIESTSLSEIEVSNSINKGEFQGVNLIVANPLFVSDDDLRLSPDSPGINAGIPSISITRDLLGNPRPQPAGTNPDLGCYELNQDVISSTSEAGILEQINIFPNPTRDKISLTKIVDEIQLYDFNGRLVQSAQKASSVSAKDLPAGTYTIRLMINGQSITESISIIE